jgi:hypothetical protein
MKASVLAGIHTGEILWARLSVGHSEAFNEFHEIEFVNPQISLN